jgi:hypothetical protein
LPFWIKGFLFGKDKNMKEAKKVLTLFLATMVALAVLGKTANVPSAHGNYYYYEEEIDIYIDKMVSLPREDNQGVLVFRDNLSDADGERYQKDQIVVFELRVKNVGDKTINKVTVVDKFPDYIDYPYDNGGWNDADSTYTYEIYDLEVGEEDVRQIEGRVTTDADVCLVNVAEARPEGGDPDTDTAKLCIGEEGEVLGVKVMPETGINLWVGLIVFLATGAGALLVRKKR